MTTSVPGLHLVGSAQLAIRHPQRERRDARPSCVGGVHARSERHEAAAPQPLARPRQPVVVPDDPRRRGLGRRTARTSTRSCRACSSVLAAERPAHHLLRRRPGRGARPQREADPAPSPRPATRSATTRSATSPGSTATRPTRSTTSCAGPRTRSRPSPAGAPSGSAAPATASRPTCCEVLVDRGYRYDCSTLPTVHRAAGARVLLPVGEADGRAAGRAGVPVRQLAATGCGRCKPVPVGRSARDRLLEIPVTTMPWARIPIHVSYVLYLARTSPALARAVLRQRPAAVPAGRRRAVDPAAPARLPRWRRRRRARLLPRHGRSRRREARPCRLSSTLLQPAVRGRADGRARRGDRARGGLAGRAGRRDATPVLSSAAVVMRRPLGPSRPARPLRLGGRAGVQRGAVVVDTLTQLSDYLAALDDRYRFELLVVDDGCTDETGDIADVFAETHPACASCTTR